MTYCTTADVQALNPKRPAYGTSTTPTLAQVTLFIGQVAAEIDFVLEGRGLATPVTAGLTSAKFIDWLSALNSRGAAAMAEQAQFPEHVGQSGATSATIYWRQYRDGLEFLKACNIPGAGVDTALPFSFMEKHAQEDQEPGQDQPGWSRPKIGINKEF